VSFGLIWDGSEAIIWAERDHSGAAFPYKGVITIFISWIFSPILTAACAAILFAVVRTLVLRRKNAYQLAFWTLPPIVFATTFINMYFIFTKVWVSWPSASYVFMAMSYLCLLPSVLENLREY